MMNGEWQDKARRAFCARPRSKFSRLCALEWARVYRLCDCSISYACARVFARARDTDRVCRKIRYERFCSFGSRIRMSVSFFIESVRTENARCRFCLPFAVHHRKSVRSVRLLESPHGRILYDLLCIVKWIVSHPLSVLAISLLVICFLIVPCLWS